MDPSPDLNQISAEDWEIARRRLGIIRRLADDPKRTLASVLEAAAEIGCGTTKTYDLLNRYLASSRLTSLLPRTRGRKQGRSMMPLDIDDVITAAIHETYLTRQKLRVSDLLVEVRRRSAAAALRSPSRSTLERRLNAMPPAEIVARRQGRNASRDRYAPAVGSLEAPWPLSLVQIDHTLVDVIVVDTLLNDPPNRLQLANVNLKPTPERQIANVRALTGTPQIFGRGRKPDVRDRKSVRRN